MATITFRSGENFVINELSGSGLGFYGSSGFGASVAVGEYQGRTFITDGNGVNKGPEADNVKFLDSQSGIIGQVGTGIHLTAIPNYQATLNIRFTHGSAVKTQNSKLRIYDRSNINNAPSGLVAKVAELIHPTESQLANGSGDTLWITPAGSSVIVDLVSSPGLSGLRPAGPETSQTIHDWYVAISAMPDSIGSKSAFGLFVSLEYL